MMVRELKRASATALFFCVIILSPFYAFGAGETGADFLRLEPPAENAAMSNVFAGIADDINAIIYNPAGLTSVTVTTVALTHYASIGDTNCEYICGAIPINGKFGTFGASFMATYTTDFYMYDEFGDQKGNVDNMDVVVTGSYAYPLYENFSLGANLKYFHSTLYKYSKSGFALDAGARVRLGKDPDTYAGIVIQNLGAQSAYISVVDPMPVNIKAGMGFKLKMGSLADVTMGLDVNRLISKDEMPTLDLGAEALMFDVLALRAGYGFRHDVGSLTMGIGVNLDRVKFSYSYEPFDILGTEHRISLDIALYESKPSDSQ
jgi:hypothetical protein